jgi:choline dehydrogenase-like flavoprotein
MGGDPRSVVDARLKVRGVKGLRVVDPSVMIDIAIDPQWCPPIRTLRPS